MVPLTHYDLFEVSRLTGQYTRFRAKSGEWPQLNEIVKEFSAVESKRDTRYPMRVDVYRTSQPGVTVLFKLRDDGGLYFEIKK